MTKFIFWNINRKPLEKNIARLAHRYKIDIIMLAECVTPPAVLLDCLNSPDKSDYYYAGELGCKKIKIFTKFPDRFIKILHETDSLTMRHVELPGRTDILLAVVHLRSKIHRDDIGKKIECTTLIREIEFGEEQAKHSRTVLVGDFNMNPFEEFMVAAGGLHATMSKNIAKNEKRTVGKKMYKYFYNPMWNFFGDKIHPPGTCYYNKSDYLSYFWNIFDQVLIRPELIDRFNNDKLYILYTDGENSFVSGKFGAPNRREYSDHLPILFDLSL